MLFDNFDMIEVHTPFADSLLRIRRIPDEVIHELRALYNEDGKDHNRYLVADVKRQKAPLLDQIKEKPNLFQFMCGVSLEFWKVYNRNYFLNVGMKNSSSKVTSAWFVDYDPGEYNPVHNHLPYDNDNLVDKRMTPCNAIIWMDVIDKNLEPDDADAHMSGIWNENLDTMSFDNSKNYNGDIGVWINGKYITYAPKQYECMIMSAETLHWVYPIRTKQKRLSFQWNAQTLFVENSHTPVL